MPFVIPDAGTEFRRREEKKKKVPIKNQKTSIYSMEHIGWGDVSFFFVCWYYAVAIILLIIALRVCLSTVTKNYLFKTQSQKRKKRKIPPFLIIRITTQQLAQLKLASSFRQ